MVAEWSLLQLVNYEVGAGLSSNYEQKDWTADDIHSESASRTLDYSCECCEEFTSETILNISPDEDFAVSVLASLLNKTDEEAFFRGHTMNDPFVVFNSETGFMEAKNAGGAWAGPETGGQKAIDGRTCLTDTRCPWPHRAQGWQ